MIIKGNFLPLMVIRRYLKLTFNNCTIHNLLNLKIDDLKSMELPFRIDLLPTQFPKPNELVLNITERIIE